MPYPRRTLRVLGGAALVAASLVESIRGDVPAYEERLFRAVNGADDRLRAPVRTVMQAGSFGTVPAASAVAWIARRRELALRLALGGTAAWLLAKAVKPLAGRARPRGILDDVRIRESIGGDLGWVSGHIAVATTLALVAAPELPRWSRPLLGAVV
ncbi:MAG TPA: hypothetical protein VF029_04845, partial [Actinomycetota bacterium]